jgi:precorrin-2 dehydrogenase / sirohydrochlorin ferrochelatase
MTDGYPAMLNIAGKTCVVIGGGETAARKISGLLEAGAAVTVISPEIIPGIQQMLGGIHWEQQPYTPGQIMNLLPVLVFAATDDPTTNQQIVQEARSVGAFVNSVDGSAGSDFTNMAVVRRHPLTIGIHTGGAAPGLAKHLKVKIAEAVGEEYVILARWLDNLRPNARDQLDSQAQRHQLYEAIIASDVLPLLRQGQTDNAYHEFQSIVRAWGVTL